MHTTLSQSQAAAGNDQGPRTEVAAGALRILRATPDDAAEIARIAAAVNVHKCAYLGKGFLVYTLNPNEYRKRIRDHQHLYAFWVGCKIVGFVCGYDRGQFETYLADGTLGHEPALGLAIKRQAAERGDHRYAFLDQIAILPEYQDRGLGEWFFDRFCRLVPGPYYVAMVEAPIENPRISYWRARGFSRLGRVEERLPPRFADASSMKTTFSTISWGIYVLRPVNFRARCANYLPTTRR